MTVLEINRLCDRITHCEKALEHLYNTGEMNCHDFYSVGECIETMDEALGVIKALLDTVNVI